MNAPVTPATALTRALVQAGAAWISERLEVPGVPAAQVIALPVSEHAAAGVAVGLALAGRPVAVELTSSQRLLAIVEVLHDASRAQLPAPLVVRVPYGREAGERLDLGVLDVLAGLEGVRVVCPRDGARAAALAARVLGAGGPAVWLEPRALAEGRGDVGGGDRPRDGAHVTIAAFGAGVTVALDAAERLAASGIDAAVLDVEQLAPVDAVALGAAAQRTGRLVVAAPRGERAWGERVGRVVLDAAFLYLEAPPVVAPDDDPEALAAAAKGAVTY